MCLAHIPETITYGRGLSYPSALDVCLLDPNKAWWQKNISSWSLFRAEQEPLKKKEQNCLVTACQDYTLGTSSTVNLQSVSEPRGLMLSRSWDFLSKAF